jgi:uncharacterized protein (DUF58 family)
MFARLRALAGLGPPTAAPAEVHLTPEELRELRRLHVVVGRKVDSLFSGEWRSAVRGRGMEFEEVRPYQPGDDVRRIDWNVTARTGEPFVKVFREERQAIVLLVVDVSGSTRAGTGGRDGRTNRRLQLARVAGGLALAGIRNQDRIGLLTFTDRVESYLSPRRSRGHSWAIIQKVYAPHANGRGTDLAAALAFVHNVQRRRAVVVIASDFLDDGRWQEPLGALARRHRVHALAVHDPLDAPIPGLGLLDVVDPETGERRTVDAAAWGARAAAEERVLALRRLGVRATALSTDDDAFSVLHRHFSAEGGRR